MGSAPCNATDARVVSIDWVGSPDVGAHNISQRRAVVAVTYAQAGASSTVDGCAEQQGAVHTPAAPPTRSFRIGARGDPASYGERDRLQTKSLADCRLHIHRAWALCCFRPLLPRHPARAARLRPAARAHRARVRHRRAAGAVRHLGDGLRAAEARADSRLHGAPELLRQGHLATGSTRPLANDASRWAAFSH